MSERGIFRFPACTGRKRGHSAFCTGRYRRHVISPSGERRAALSSGVSQPPFSARHENFSFSRPAAEFSSSLLRFRLFASVFTAVFGRETALRGRETAVSRSFLFFLRSLSIMGVLSTCSSGLHSLSIRKGRERKHSRHIHASCAFEKKGRSYPACTKTL